MLQVGADEVGLLERGAREDSVIELRAEA